MEYHNLKKIALKMGKFHTFKMLKTICAEWRSVTIRNNDTRMNIVKVR
jgi:hypothetical protein